MQVRTLPLTDNHASTPPLSFLQAGCPSCRPTNSVTALKANLSRTKIEKTKKITEVEQENGHYSGMWICMCMNKI